MQYRICSRINSNLIKTKQLKIISTSLKDYEIRDKISEVIEIFISSIQENNLSVRISDQVVMNEDLSSN